MEDRFFEHEIDGRTIVVREILPGSYTGLNCSLFEIDNHPRKGWNRFYSIEAVEDEARRLFEKNPISMILQKLKPDQETEQCQKENKKKAQ